MLFEVVSWKSVLFLAVQNMVILNTAAISIKDGPKTGMESTRKSFQKSILRPNDRVEESPRHLYPKAALQCMLSN